jgi:hypothetical protein
MDSHMDTEIPVIETDESLFDVLPKLFKWVLPVFLNKQN